MTDDTTWTSGQKNRAPKGVDDLFRCVRNPHRGFGPAFAPLPAETGHQAITLRRHLWVHDL